MPQLRGNISPGRFMKIVFPFPGGLGQLKADLVEREKELCTRGLSVQARLAVSGH